MDSRHPPLSPACQTLPEYVRHWAATTPDRLRTPAGSTGP